MCSWERVTGGMEEDTTGNEAVKHQRGSGSWVYHSMHSEITQNDYSGGKRLNEPGIKIFDD